MYGTALAHEGHEDQAVALRLLRHMLAPRPTVASSSLDGLRVAVFTFSHGRCAMHRLAAVLTSAPVQPTVAPASLAASASGITVFSRRCSSKTARFGVTGLIVAQLKKSLGEENDCV